MNHRDTETGRTTDEQESDPLTFQVIGAAIDIHKALGPGLLESAYEECLCHELQDRRLPFERQVFLPVTYKSVQIDCGYRLDLIVDRRLVVELKTVERLAPIHDAQLLTYMKLGGYPTGLLINFNAPVIKNGLRRMVL